MEEKIIYKLPELQYKHNDLEPYISEQVLTLHHQKHHKSYVDNTNILLEKIWEARKNNQDLDQKSILKSLSFNLSGHILHSIFWNIMAPVRNASRSDTGGPVGKIAKAIEKEFSSFERFKKEFSETAKSVEGSGWVALTHDKSNEKLLLMQIEKHNLNFYPEHKILLLLDVWEHAYYLDYKNDRAKFIENWWNIVNWQEVEKRLEK